MIKVSTKEENNKIEEISISGHALYDDYGKDIVCASVSSIVITTVNAIERIDNSAISHNEGSNLKIKVLKHSDVIDILIDNMLDLLKELAHDYKENIKFL